MGCGARKGLHMIGRIIETQDDVDEGTAWLAKAEPRFAHALTLTGPVPLRRSEDGFDRLLSAITSQQVSVASAAAIWNRLCQAELTTPAAVAAAGEEGLRGAGLSKPKARYAAALAAADLDYVALRQMPSQAAMDALTAQLGIGAWTAEVYLISALGRADVFAPADLALQEAARLLFGLEARPAPKNFAKMAESWSPWRAVAARLLWSYYKVAKNREGTT